MRSLISPESVRHYYESGGPKIEMSLWNYVTKWAEEFPGKKALLEFSASGSRREVTYAELHRNAGRVAVKLLELGIGREDVVAFQLANVIEQCYVRLACVKIGAIMMPLGEGLREYDLEYLLEKARPKIIFTHGVYRGVDFPQMYLTMRENLPNEVIEQIVVIGDYPDQRVSLFSDFLDPHLDDKQGVLEDFTTNTLGIEQFVCTSGTTGRPKIIMQTALLNQSCLINFLIRGHLGADDVFLAVTSMGAGLTGAGMAFVIPMMAGGTAIFLPDFAPEMALKVIEQERVSAIGGVPPMATRLVNHPAWERTDKGSLRRFINAGGPVPRDTAQRLMDVGCLTISGYGASEALACVITSDEEPEVVLEGKVGKPIPGFEARVIDDNGNVLPPGENGEVVWRTVCAGYYANPELNREAWDAENWYHSGDVGFFDTEGNLKIIGRKTEMILRGAQNISPKEIEEVLHQHPKVAEVAVVGMPDKELGEKACAFVVLKPGETFTFEEMQHYLAERKVSKYKWPERLEYIDKLPLSEGGKIATKVLKEIIAGKLRSEGVLEDVG